jgi:hypothetical protein
MSDWKNGHCDHHREQVLASYTPPKFAMKGYKDASGQFKTDIECAAGDILEWSFFKNNSRFNHARIKQFVSNPYNPHRHLQLTAEESETFNVNTLVCRMIDNAFTAMKENEIRKAVDWFNKFIDVTSSLELDKRDRFNLYKDGSSEAAGHLCRAWCNLRRAKEGVNMELDKRIKLLESAIEDCVLITGIVYKKSKITYRKYSVNFPCQTKVFLRFMPY